MLSLLVLFIKFAVKIEKMSKALKWIGIIVGTPMVLFLLLALLIYLPPVQNFLVKKATAIASDELGMNVSIERVRLAFPLDLALDKFVAVQGKDTVLAAGSLTADVEILPLFQQVVNINGLTLDNVRVNTLDLIDAVQIQGKIPHFYMYSHGIHLKPSTITINEAELRGADLMVALNDSVPEDTVPSEPTPWQILLEKAQIRQSRIQLLMDSMKINLALGDAALSGTTMNLTDNLYQVKKANFLSSAVAVDLDMNKPAPGLDYAHLALDSLNLEADSLVSQGSFLKLNLASCQFKERCGLRAESLTGKILMDSLSIHALGLELKTPNSKANLHADVDWSSLDEKGNGLMKVLMNAEVGKSDVLLAVGEQQAKEIQGMYPNVPFVLDLSVQGNMQQMLLEKADAQLKGMVDLKANGTINHVMDEANRSGALNLRAQVGNVHPLLTLAGLNDYTIPQGTRAEGKATMQGTRYSFAGNVHEGTGSVDLKGLYDTKTDRYEASVLANQLNLHHFMPKDSLFLFTGSFSASGLGTDIQAQHAVADVQADITQLQFKKYDLKGINVDAKLKENLLKAHAGALNDFLDLTADIDAFIKKDTIGGKMTAEVQKVDMMHLGALEKKLDLGLHLVAEGGYNYKENISVEAKIDNIKLVTEKQTFKPKDLTAKAFLNSDTISVQASAGDFVADVRTRGGLSVVQEQGKAFWDLLVAQQKEHSLQFPELKSEIPVTRIELKSGKNNPISNFMAMKGYGYRSMHAIFETNPTDGLKGDAHVYALNVDSLRLDTIRFSVAPNKDKLRFTAQVRNNRYNPQFVFNAMVNGTLMEDGAIARMQLYDDKNVLGVDMGLRAQLLQAGYLFTFRPTRPYIAYHYFNVTPEDAYVFVHDDGKIEGNLNLFTDDGMGLAFLADPEEDEQQCMKIDLQNINLEEIASVVPYMPRMSGVMNGKLHAHQPMDGAMKADGELHFANLLYEESPMGNIDLAMEYIPSGEDEHTVSMSMHRNGMLVSQLSGTYVGSTQNILLDAQLIRFPAEIVNGFIPDHMFGLRGTLEGKFKLTGDTGTPIVDGTVRTDSVFIYSDMYNLNLRVKDAEMPIDKSRFTMKNFILYSEKNDELVTNGMVDFANLEKIAVDFSMRAKNFQVIDRPRNLVSQLYGKAFMNLDATAKGFLDDLKVRGTVDLLGSTDVTYVLKDSPITVEDRLNDLVTFIDFSDSTRVEQQIARKELSGMDLVLNLNISEGAAVNCDLSANRESYVELEGGGNLIFRYTPEGEMLLTGRYTINEGEMKYALPVIPLKQFKLANGSYVQFNGDIMNPTLNITATEQTRASVASDGGSPRNVLFDVGVKITQTLSNMGLEFIIDAPEDLTVQNELAGFSKETKNKLAVSMLATGLYLSEENAMGNVKMSSALNSFLQSEISNIAGNALQSIDLSFGMEDGTASDGSSTTDYSFRFAKRFWGNRVSIIVGGKVSTGAKANATDSFIDDVSIEYRLDDSGTRYVKLFHEKNFDSLLDGEITEMGGGVVLRKKMTRFGELFIFRNSKTREVMEEQRERRKMGKRPSQKDKKTK